MKTGTERALKQAQELLRTLLSPDVFETAAVNKLIDDLDSFLASYGSDGETKL